MWPTLITSGFTAWFTDLLHEKSSPKLWWSRHYWAWSHIPIETAGKSTWYAFRQSVSVCASRSTTHPVLRTHHNIYVSHTELKPSICLTQMFPLNLNGSENVRKSIYEAPQLLLFTSEVSSWEATYSKRLAAIICVLWWSEILECQKIRSTTVWPASSQAPTKQINKLKVTKCTDILLRCWDYGSIYWNTV